jgi:hypothetical protein
MCLQYVGTHPLYGDCVLTSPRLRDGGCVEPVEALFEDAFFVFFPVTAAVRKSLGTVVKEGPAPAMPSQIRRAGAIDREGRVLTWVVQDVGAERVVRSLSREERAFTIGRIMNIEALGSKLREGWRPETTV